MPCLRHTKRYFSIKKACANADPKWRWRGSNVKALLFRSCILGRAPIYGNPEKNHHHRSGNKSKGPKPQACVISGFVFELAHNSIIHSSHYTTKVVGLCENKKGPAQTQTRSGGGGGRTRVQTRNPRAFYMFSQPFDPPTRARQAAAKPESQPLNLARQPRHMPRYLFIDDTP